MARKVALIVIVTEALSTEALQLGRGEFFFGNVPGGFGNKCGFGNREVLVWFEGGGVYLRLLF